MTRANPIRPSVAGNWRPIDHMVPVVEATDPGDAAAATRHVHRHLGHDPAALADVLAMLGLAEPTDRPRCTVCRRTLARGRNSTHGRGDAEIHHYQDGMCRRCHDKSRAWPGMTDETTTGGPR